MNAYRSNLNYETQQVINNLNEMFVCIQNYRRKMKKNSILNVEEYGKRFDVFAKAARS